MPYEEEKYYDDLKKAARDFLNRGKPKPTILDSGNRREFETGAVRDIQEGKGRCDLLPFDIIADYYDSDSIRYMTTDVCTSHRAFSVFTYIQTFVNSDNCNCLYDAIRCADIFEDDATMFLEVSEHFEEGAKKYGENNWQKGIPTHCYIDSAIRHYLKYLRGDTDERHDRAFCWNLLCCAWTCINKPELDDYRKEEKK